MFDTLCEQTHRQLLAGTCPWCGKQIVQTPDRQRAYGQSEHRSGNLIGKVQVVQVQLPKPLKVDTPFEIQLEDEPESVAEALLTISSEMELEGFPSTDIFVIHMAVEGAMAAIKKQGKHAGPIVACSIEPGNVFVHFKG